MNRPLWDNFIQQINAQVEGDFVELANEYESVEGHPFTLDDEPQVLFSMLEQAMMSQNSHLLTLTVSFISLMPLDFQRAFRVFGRRRMNFMHKSSHLEQRAADR
ncbi:MAG: hypothetical protein ACI9NY_000710 [Kiritimatiellia bacterium]|jgi:hypothetical protein